MRAGMACRAMAAGLLVACGGGELVSLSPDAPPGTVIDLHLAVAAPGQDPASGRMLQGLVRRWRTVDVGAFALAVTVDGKALPGMILPVRTQPGEASGQISGLAPGARVSLSASALASGSGAVLSAYPATAEVRVGSGQDVEDTVALALRVPLPDATFSGRVDVVIEPPAGTPRVSLQLMNKATGLADWSGEYPGSSKARVLLAGLATGPTWTLVARNRPLSCQKGGCSGKPLSSSFGPFRFDPGAGLLEDSLAATLSVWN